MVQEFLQKNTTNYYYEKLMIFDDFEQFLPVVKKERFENPDLFSLDFFAISKEKRDRPFRFTHEFEDQKKIEHKKIKGSVDNDEWKINLETPGIGMGWQISVRDLKSGKILGHNKFDYYSKKRELLWLRFDQPYQTAKDNGKTQSGIPECIYMQLD